MKTTALQSRFGIEIEVVGITRSQIAQAVHSVTGGTISDRYETSVTMTDGRVWNIVRDGSLSSDTYAGEIVSPILTVADLDMLQQIVRAVRAAGGRADASCGIHIHLDGSRFDARSVSNLVRLVYRREAAFQSAFAVAERRLSSYCKSMSSTFVSRLDRAKTMADIKAAWYEGSYGDITRKYHDSRYHGLNLHSLFYRGTIEFRYFNGTVHAGEIKAYVHFVLALAELAIAQRSARAARPERDAKAMAKGFANFLRRLGLNGPEYKNTRLHLTRKFVGSEAA